jgi:peptidoglycan/LPS O-acetylase OafA/YrhL
MQVQVFFRRVDEFDLLRAFAVTGVVLGHVFKLSGGFLGVDIFFVISGYVITLMLLQSAKADFSFGEFYYRRIVRIIPPLAVVSIAIYLVSWFVFILMMIIYLYGILFYSKLFCTELLFYVPCGRLLPRVGISKTQSSHLVACGRGTILPDLPIGVCCSLSI